MKTPIKHIVFISPSFAKDEQNGIVVPPLHLFLRQIVRTFPLVKLSVIALHFPFHQTHYRVFDVDVFPLGGANSTFVKRPLIWRKLVKTFKAIHTNQPVDFIHSFWLNESAFLSQQLARKYSLRHFCTMMGQDARPTNRYLPFINLKKLNLIALSDFQKNVLKNHAETRSIHVIPWGVADFDIPRKPQQKRELDLLCVSSLIPLKRVELFVELVFQLKKDFPKIKAAIVGGGVLHKQIETLLAEKGLKKNVVLHGLLPRQDALKVMETAKALVHTSSYEAQGYVLNEALALGCEVFSLSQGLVVDEPKFHQVKSQVNLVQMVKDYLSQNEKNTECRVPLKMENTLKAYQHVYAQEGLFFR